MPLRPLVDGGPRLAERCRLVGGICGNEVCELAGFVVEPQRGRLVGFDIVAVTREQERLGREIGTGCDLDQFVCPLDDAHDAQVVVDGVLGINGLLVDESAGADGQDGQDAEGCKALHANGDILQHGNCPDGCRRFFRRRCRSVCLRRTRVWRVR